MKQQIMDVQREPEEILVPPCTEHKFSVFLTPRGFCHAGLALLRIPPPLGEDVF